ncbi:hypothetical protein F1880_006732 [Penicillium rolfsii]|nr:hypothetical protein F1880_006732 [Penicillium rolfsii]
MFSCANYPRGCRGRVNRQGAKCSDCVVCRERATVCTEETTQILTDSLRQTLNLRRPASASPFAQPRDYKRVLPSERLSDSAFKVSDLEL